MSFSTTINILFKYSFNHSVDKLMGALILLFLAQPIIAQTVQRGPYIQCTTPSSTVIRWQTTSATDSKLWYGNQPGNLTQTLTSSTINTEHELLVSGLEPNTKYFYAFGNAAEVMEGDTADYYFKTHPIIGSKEKFHTWVMGDPGTGYEEQLEVRDLYYNTEPGGETPFMITLGDNAYEDGEIQEFDDFFFDIYRDIFRRTTVWPLPGNHDYHACEPDDEEGPFFDLFTNPQNGESGGAPSGSQRYYSFDYANVHFIVVEGYEQDGQVEWLEQDLAQNTQDWTIALAHHPPYSDGNHDSDNNGTMSYVREVLLPMLETAGVDMFMSGHSHVYERSFLIHGHYGESNELEDTMIIDGGSGKMDVDGAYQKSMLTPNGNQGTVYLVSGTSGGKSPDGSLNHPIMYEDHKKEGYGVLEVENDTLNYIFYQSNGVIRDYFTIVKELLTEDADNDSYSSDVDCDDTDPLINPGATEILDNDVDEDCDGIAQMTDADNDNYNSDVDCDDTDPLINPGATEIPNNDVDEDCDGIAQIIDADNDTYNSDVDCDETDPLINPGATEIPNNDVDEDCDGIAQVIDEDNDNYNSDVDCDETDPLINPGATEIPNNDVDEDCDGIAQMIDVDNDGFNSDVDCDDENPNIYPGAPEIPENGVDEDCDGSDGDMVIDNDGDGYNSVEDCDDNNASANPGEMEILNNNVDENCDGYAAYDLDNDGYTDDVDCDDMNPAINPGASEIANNDVDENCDNIIIYIDFDGDGYNYGDDCNDQDASVNPGAIEIINNDVDENCDDYIAYDLDMDGFLDDVDCDDNNPDINPDASEIVNNNIDENCDDVIEIIDVDNDGFNSDIDCDDTNPNIYPGAPEIPNNGIDEDCDGVDSMTVVDSDNDSYNNDVDCDDTDPAINPGATEIPNNNVDEDCDGIAQIIDMDMDGFNSDDDCDDTNADINEDAIEIPNNGIDEDCDGQDLISSLNPAINTIGLKAYPNPTEDFLTIETELTGDYEIRIYNVIGQEVLLLEVSSQINKLDVSNLESGLYLLFVKDSTQTGLLKFAKK